MKRRLLIIGIVVLLCAGAATLWTYRQRLFAPREVSETYIKYADRQDIKATYITDFRINDTVTVAVTVLVAQDQEAWSELLSTFMNMHIDLYPEPVRLTFLNGGDVVSLRSYPANQPQQQLPLADIDDIEVAISYNATRTIYVFHAHTQECAWMIGKNRLYKHFEYVK